MNELKQKDLEEKINYQFNNKKNIIMAMTHSSYANENKLKKIYNNERLEFLGDSVLEVVTSEFLYLNFKSLPEGELTKLRASIVCEQSLAHCARNINLNNYILLGKGEERCGGRDKNSIISDALEALIGAIYLDGGITSAKEFIYKFILLDIEDTQLFYDSKTILQEHVQAKHGHELSYELISSDGPDHNREFKINALLGDEIIGQGIGRSKKTAEQQAAYNALKNLDAIKKRGN